MRGVAVENVATAYEVHIRQSGLEQTVENESLSYWDVARGPLTNGEVVAVLDYAGQRVQSDVSKFGRLSIPQEANVMSVNLANLYQS